MTDLEYMTCPRDHPISRSKENFARDFSNNRIDSNFRPIYELGLYCCKCNKAYGFSKLKLIEKDKTDIER